MGGIIIVDLYLQRINQEAQRRQCSAATTGVCAGGRQCDEEPEKLG